MSRPYAEVIGDPIAHSKSPLIHNFWLDLLGIDAEYRRSHVLHGELAEFFARRRGDRDWRGCNITVPHKETSRLFVDGLLAGYEDIGAINLALPRGDGLLGGNTDPEGVIGPINAFHGSVFNFQPVSLRKVGIIGAGGAARAAVAALKSLGWVGEWRIAVRSPDKGKALLAAFGLSGSVIPIEDQALAGLDILINASTMGMGEGGDSSLTLAELGHGVIQPLLFDMVYYPLETGLIRAARKQGHAIIDGLDMLVGQASGAFTHFFGQRPPRESFSELRRLLIA
jgi:shikimate dehydrogenase